MPESEFVKSIDLMLSQPWLRLKQGPYFDLLTECPSAKHRAMLLSLLTRTTYVPASVYFDAIKQLKEHVEKVWKLIPEKTIFVSSNNKNHTDSSQEVLNQLKSSDWSDPKWSKFHFLTRYRDALPKLSAGHNVVLVDDFVGSGGSILKSLDWFSKNVGTTSINLHVLTVTGCTTGMAAIAKSGFSCHSVFQVAKGLSDFLVGGELAEALKQMADLEALLEAKIGPAALEKYRLGWGAQEAVYVRDGGNTPNNVFPIFWWNKIAMGTRRTIMHRT